MPPGPSDTPAAACVVVRVFACTDVGRTREHNEDAFLVADLHAESPLLFERGADGAEAAARELRAGPSEMLFVVADGLGGAAAGEVASHVAVGSVFAALRERLPDASGEPGRFAGALRDAALAANSAIHLRGKAQRELHGMGTTLTAAALLGDSLFLAQVGDSRAYLLRDGAVRQITKDQSLMQKLVEAGEITPEQAEVSARRNIILQALGPEASVKVDLTHQPLRRGDLLVLCSDGLSGQVRAEEIGDIAARATDLDALCRQLIARANERGGPDNITVVAARFDGDALTLPLDGDAVGHRAFPLGDVDDGPTQRFTRPRLPPELAELAELGERAPAVPQRGPMTPLPASAPDVGALGDRRERVRRYYVALAVAALLVALVSVWRFVVR